MSKIVKPLSDDQIAVVEMLKEALAQALEGKFQTAAVVVCLEDGFASAMAGHDAGTLNLACDDLKTKIMDAVRIGTEEKLSRRSAILRPMQ